VSLKDQWLTKAMDLIEGDGKFKFVPAPSLTYAPFVDRATLASWCEELSAGYSDMQMEREAFAMCAEAIRDMDSRLSAAMVLVKEWQLRADDRYTGEEVDLGRCADELFVVLASKPTTENSLKTETI